MPGNPKGDRAERNLATLLDESGYAVMRAPASGSASDRSLPDLFAGRGGDLFALELKRPSKKPVYLSEEELDSLRFFADHFGARALIGVKFDVEYGDPPYGNDADPGWRFFESDDPSLHVSDAGSTRVKREKAYGEGLTFAELFSPEIVADGGVTSSDRPLSEMIEASAYHNPQDSPWLPFDAEPYGTRYIVKLDYDGPNPDANSPGDQRIVKQTLSREERDAQTDRDRRWKTLHDEPKGGGLTDRVEFHELTREIRVYRYENGKGANS